MSHNPFSNEANVHALYGKAAHIRDVCAAICSLNSTVIARNPEPTTPEEKEAVAREEEAQDRRRREFLGAWLAKATPEDLRILADWRDRPDWSDPVDKKHFGIVLAINQKAVEEAVAAKGFQVLNQATLAQNPSASPHVVCDVKFMGPADVAPLSNEELSSAFDSNNRRVILSRTPDSELQAAISNSQMGQHSVDAIRKHRERKFKATRKGPGRPKKRK